MGTDLYISSQAGLFDISPYEQFISGWPSPERSPMPDLYISSQAGRFDIAPYEQFISGWPSPERSQMTSGAQGDGALHESEGQAQDGVQRSGVAVPGGPGASVSAGLRCRKQEKLFRLQWLAAVFQHFEKARVTSGRRTTAKSLTRIPPRKISSRRWSRSRSRQTRSQSTRSRQTRSQSTTRRAPVWSGRATSISPPVMSS